MFPGAAQNLYLKARYGFTPDWRAYCEKQAGETGIELLSLEQAATPADLGLQNFKRASPEPDQGDRNRHLKQAAADAENPRVPTPEVAAKLESPEAPRTSPLPLLVPATSAVAILTTSASRSLTTSTSASLLVATSLPNVLPSVIPLPLQMSTSSTTSPFMVPTTAPQYHALQPTGGFGRGQTAPPFAMQPPFQSSSGTGGSRSKSRSTGQYSQTSPNFQSIDDSRRPSGAQDLYQSEIENLVELVSSLEEHPAFTIDWLNSFCRSGAGSPRLLNSVRCTLQFSTSDTSPRSGYIREKTQVSANSRTSPTCRLPWTFPRTTSSSSTCRSSATSWPLPFVINI